LCGGTEQAAKKVGKADSPWAEAHEERQKWRTYAAQLKAAPFQDTAEIDFSATCEAARLQNQL
jgi:hypothetical protein